MTGMPDNPPEQVARIPTALVADDEEGARNALAEVLRRSGYDVQTAADGREAVERLKTVKIDVLLLDLQMPTYDGFETLAYVQEHRQGLPIVLLTGLPPDEIQALMSKGRMTELPPLLEKPCDPDQLLQLLELVISGDLEP